MEAQLDFFRMLLSGVAVLHVFTHKLGCMLEALLDPSCIYKLSYSDLAHQLPWQFAESPSLEVFKNRTKYPSVHNGFDAVLLIRRNSLDFSVKISFSVECS
jgi:hypothetical protein